MGMSGKAQTYGLYLLVSNVYSISDGMNPLVCKFTNHFKIDDIFIITIIFRIEIFLIANSFLP